MSKPKSAYRAVLEEENAVLDDVLAKQKEFRAAVNGRQWPDLVNVISAINLRMDQFNRLDERRAAFSASEEMDGAECSSILAEVRGKLVRCMAENKALGDYINITRNFVKGVIDNALPQSRSMVYSRSGAIVRQQPQSVVVNTLF
ncbi:MAG: hypothetical protein K2H09_03005 [Treponemataceae bacterium]|nr:hypothetical protein [Treponemataceae bacterium]